MSETPENSNEPKRLTGLSIPTIIVLAILVLLSGLMAQRLVQGPTGSTPDPVPTPAASGTPLPQSDGYVLFVPNDNATLSRETVPDPGTPPNASYSQKAERALALLFDKLEFLPEGTKLRAAPVKDENGVVRVDLTKPFMELDSQPETPVMLTLDAMARTLGALDSADDKTFESAKMQILIDGKTIKTLSQFSMDEPWTASETAPETPDPKDAV